MTIRLADLFQAYWPSIKDGLNSVFFTSIVGAGVATFAGAYIAQKIAEKNKDRDELLREIRSTNAAVTVASAILDSFFGLMRQQVKDMKEKFDRGKTQFLAQQNSGQVVEKIPDGQQLDLRSLLLPPMPLRVLRQLVFEKLTLSGRAPRLQIAVEESANSLRQFSEKRNEPIERYKGSNLTNERLAELYFGVPGKLGSSINEEYPSCMNAIHMHTKDGIFFSQLLCKDLEQHGKQLGERFARKYGGHVPTTTSVDLSELEKSGLIPDAVHYPNWMTNFSEKTPNARSRWERFKRKVLWRNVTD